MSYALQLQEQRKARLMRMGAIPRPVEQRRAESVVPAPDPVINSEPVKMSAAQILQMQTEIGIRKALEAASRMRIVYVPAKKPPLRIQDVVRIVADFYGIADSKLLANRRTVDIVLPRQIAAYLAVQLSDKSLPEIGRRMGGRDHTTILHSARKIAREIARKADLKEVVTLLSNQILAHYEVTPKEVSQEGAKPRLLWTDEMTDFLRANWGVLPKKAIARRLGVTPISVYRRASRIGLRATPGRPRGTPVENHCEVA